MKQICPYCGCERFDREAIRIHIEIWHEVSTVRIDEPPEEEDEDDRDVPHQ